MDRKGGTVDETPTAGERGFTTTITCKASARMGNSHSAFGLCCDGKGSQQHLRGVGAAGLAGDFSESVLAFLQQQQDVSVSAATDWDLGQAAATSAGT